MTLDPGVLLPPADPAEAGAAAATATAQQRASQRGEEAPSIDLRQFVTFVVGNDVFAVDMAPVQEIIRVPDVVRVPLAPPSLEGLANLRGRVLPIISLRRLFGFEERAADDASRAVVIDQGQPLGFVVDRVASVIGVDPRQIDDVGALASTIDTELVSGVLKDTGGHPMIMVLDFARLIEREFGGAAAQAVARGRTGHADSNADANAEPNADSKAESRVEAGNEAESDAERLPAGGDELQLVSFEVAGQEYAITIEHVQEIVQLPRKIVAVPHAEAHVLGLMTLRNRLLPLLSLRHMFGLPVRDPDEDSRIVVVTQGGASVGVVMDRVNAVLRIARADVDAVPPMLTGHLTDITQICRLDQGRRLVSILSAGNLFRHGAVKQALSQVDTVRELNSADLDEDARDDEEQVVVFLLGKEEFGVPIDCVQEIVRVADQLTRVPRAPPAVEGVINLRGAVLPVIDLRRRLGLAPVERSDAQRIVVFLIRGVRTGFIVDSVAEVLKLPKASIESAPCVSKERSGLLARMANLQQHKRLLQLVDPLHLIEQEEQETLALLVAA